MREMRVYILHKSFHKTDTEGALPNTFDEIGIIIIPKSDKKH